MRNVISRPLHAYIENALSGELISVIREPETEGNKMGEGKIWLSYSIYLNLQLFTHAYWLFLNILGTFRCHLILSPRSPQAVPPQGMHTQVCDR